VSSKLRRCPYGLRPTYYPPPHSRLSLWLGRSRSGRLHPVCYRRARLYLCVKAATPVSLAARRACWAAGMWLASPALHAPPARPFAYPLLHAEPHLRTSSSLFAVRRVLSFHPIATSLTAGSDPQPFFHSPPLAPPSYTRVPCHTPPPPTPPLSPPPGHDRSRPVRYPVPRALSRYISPRALYMRSSHCST
jgi:hypothetical protein